MDFDDIIDIIGIIISCAICAAGISYILTTMEIYIF